MIRKTILPWWKADYDMWMWIERKNHLINPKQLT